MNTAVRAERRAPAGLRGHAAARRRARLVADDGTEIEASDDETIGEVAVRGPNLFTGYLNRPDATAEAMRDGWFFTGDLGTRGRRTATGGSWAGARPT